MDVAADLILIMVPSMVVIMWFAPRYYRSTLFDQRPSYDKPSDETQQRQWDDEIRPRLIRRADKARKLALLIGAILCAAAAMYLILT